MKKIFKTICAVVAWGVIAAALASVVLPGCSCSGKEIAEDVCDDGLLLNDDLVAMRAADGSVTIKNTKTGVVTIRDIRFDWTETSGRDSLAVFSAEDRRGYYNKYTGEIVVQPQYRRAWIFSDGLAAVQKNGNIGFINHSGDVVIDFKYPYHGNSLSNFVFEDGHCIVADTTGHCGVIDKSGIWLIRPEYDYVSTFEDYAIVSKAGVNMQVAYDGTVINSFVLDDLKELTYTEEERYVDRNGEVCYVEKPVSTGYFAYTVGGRCGLMDGKCHRLTEPLYRYISAVNGEMFRATLLDYSSEVILDGKGVVMK